MFPTGQRLQRPRQLCVGQRRLRFELVVGQDVAWFQVCECEEDDHAHGGEVDFPLTFTRSDFEIGGAEEALPGEAAAGMAGVVECLVVFEGGEEGWGEREREGEEGGGRPVGGG